MAVEADDLAVEDRRLAPKFNGEALGERRE